MVFAYGCQLKADEQWMVVVDKVGEAALEEKEA